MSDTIGALANYDQHTLAEALTTRWHNPIHAVTLLRRLFWKPEWFLEADRWTSGLNVPKRLLAELMLSPIRCASVLRRHRSADGTVKLLIAFPDGQTTEAVMMPQDRTDRVAVCVSSQVGCAMGCGFCASTKAGLKRNLTAGEIVEQYLYLWSEAAAIGRRIANVVFMGMGEPMQNLDAVMDAIRRISERGIGTIGRRHITVSTVGIVPGIDRLAASGLRTYLALSLHAPDDATRQQIVPMNRRYGVAEIIDATKRYQETTGRISIIEYCLLAGVNDSLEHAAALAELLDGFRVHVNIIPYNSIADADYRRPDDEHIDRFLAVLRNAGAAAHIRRTRGDEVAAACGQLATQQVVQIGS